MNYYPEIDIWCEQKEIERGGRGEIETERERGNESERRGTRTSKYYVNTAQKERVHRCKHGCTRQINLLGKYVVQLRARVCVCRCTTLTSSCIIFRRVVCVEIVYFATSSHFLYQQIRKLDSLVCQTRHKVSFIKCLWNWFVSLLVTAPVISMMHFLYCYIIIYTFSHILYYTYNILKAQYKYRKIIVTVQKTI